MPCLRPKRTIGAVDDFDFSGFFLVDVYTNTRLVVSGSFFSYDLNKDFACILGGKIESCRVGYVQCLIERGKCNIP